MINERKIWHIRRPYKTSRKVTVYKNLYSGMWSVRQDGIVVVHATHVFLRDVEFRVQQAGRLRVIKTRCKNVHAFVSGYLCNAAEIRQGTAHLSDEELHHTDAYYNPYTCETFVDKDTGLGIMNADFCDMDVFDPSPVIAIWKHKELVEA